MFEERKQSLSFIKLKRHYFKRPDGLTEEETCVWVASSHIAMMVEHPAIANEPGYTELLVDGGPVHVEETVKQIQNLMGLK